jgi:hypothetical protein
MTKISQLTNIGASLAANDEFIIRDVSDASTPNKKVTSSGFVDYIIAQGTGAGFTQIAAGVGPLARALATSSGATGTLTFSTAAATTLIERMRIDNAGRVLVGTATANNSGAKLQTSDGLTFPATAVASADPNTLDDYEEGTWTPVVFDTSDNNITSSFNFGFPGAGGNYTKIGRTVTVLLGLYSGDSTISALIKRIEGLPFTNNSNGTSVPFAHFGGSNSDRTDSTAKARIPTGESQIRVNNSISIAQYQTGLFFSAVYYT